jgi:predicted NAD/FAD-dependent oxidoreductase
LQHNDFESLKKVRYDKTISVQLLLNRPSKIPAPGGWQKPCENVHFICSNRQKGIAVEEAITVHMDPNFSDKYFEMKDEEELKKLVYQNVEKFLDIDSVISFDVFRWRYAVPTVEYGAKYLHCKFGESKSISFCGDSFGWRIEGAFLSGFHLGKHLSNL